MASMRLSRILILSLFGSFLISCSNSIPNVTSLNSNPSGTPTIVPAKDGSNFAQINAGSKKSTSTDLYQATVRVSQSVGQLKTSSADGYTMHGSVTLQK